MFVEIDGARAYAYTGARAPVTGQPTVVFVHGAGLDHTVWTLQARYFAHHGCNAYAVDLPGHGRSEGPPLAAIETGGAWLNKFCRVIAHGQAVMVAGHSMGSLVALEGAAQAGSGVSALALVGTAVPMPVAAVLQHAADADDHAAYDMITLWGLSLPAQVGGGPHTPGEWLTASSLRLLERSGPGVLGNDLRACNHYEKGVQSAGEITADTLLILGQLDLMTPPRATENLHAALAKARRVEVAGTGHMLMAEQPDAVLEALIDLFQGAAANSA
ncbi:MAG: alpha/beta fold hydrolase [Gammaproteobacteria bacterium]|nr:alpha/beta fold hydrolase [Gammaproteobacteria bacterium]